MNTFFNAVIFANQTPCVSNDELDLTAQLFRTTKYCLNKDLVILKTFLEYDNMNDEITFYQMLKYINRLHKTVAVVFDSADHLPIHNFKQIVMLDFLLNNGSIEIHLVEENVSIIDIKNKDELKLWSKYTHTNPMKMKKLRRDIDNHKDLKLNPYYRAKTNLV